MRTTDHGGHGPIGAGRPYEERLRDAPRWALVEASRHFEQGGKVDETLRRIAARLGALGIPYAVAGDLAMFRHGYRRFSEYVELLVTPEGLAAIHRELDGLGYVPPFKKSKNLRDAELGVRIEFIVTGAYPGDGKPKPVAFPDPEQTGEEHDGIRFVNLPTLVELKLASGMSSPGRLRDLADVMELIRVLKLPEGFSGRLDPYVRGKYAELWAAAQANGEPEQQ